MPQISEEIYEWPKNMFTLRSKWPSWWYASVALVELHRTVRFHPFQNDFGCPNAWFHQLNESRSSLPHGDAKMMEKWSNSLGFRWIGSLVEWWDMVRCFIGEMILLWHRFLLSNFRMLFFKFLVTKLTSTGQIGMYLSPRLSMSLRSSFQIWSFLTLPKLWWWQVVASSFPCRFFGLIRNVGCFMMSPFLFVKSACVLWISLDDISYVIWSPMRQQGSMRVLGACRTCITSCRANACPASTFLDQRIYDGFVFGVGNMKTSWKVEFDGLETCIWCTLGKEVWKV